MQRRSMIRKHMNELRNTADLPSRDQFDFGYEETSIMSSENN